MLHWITRSYVMLDCAIALHACDAAHWHSARQPCLWDFDMMRGHKAPGKGVAVLLCAIQQTEPAAQPAAPVQNGVPVSRRTMRLASDTHVQTSGCFERHHDCARHHERPQQEAQPAQQLHGQLRAAATVQEAPRSS
jgi:hypothetical protein